MCKKPCKIQCRVQWKHGYVHGLKELTEQGRNTTCTKEGVAVFYEVYRQWTWRSERSVLTNEYREPTIVVEVCLRKTSQDRVID